MTQALEPYYERELAFIQDYARQFARQYPAEAGRLVRDPRLVTDPHADRLIEGFTLLAARIHYKIDSEFPELTEALLGALYPHLLAPVPPMAIAQFDLEAAHPLPRGGLHVPRATPLLGRPVGNPPFACRWRTGYPVDLWPLRVADARWLGPPLPPSLNAPPRTQGALQLRLECLGDAALRELPLETLRFHLSGERQLIANLYEFLFNHASGVLFRSPEKGSKIPPVTLAPAKCLAQVGLGREEGLLPWPEQSFLGYRLLTEWFSFREKFLFLDLGGWREVRAAGHGKSLEIYVFCNRTQTNVEQGVNTRTFLLGCTPVVNLFEQSAEPVSLTQTRVEYRLVPTRVAPLGAEVYSVDEVTCLDPERGTVPLQPFYSFAYNQSREDFSGFWYAARRASPVEGDRGTEIHLVIMDRGFDPKRPTEAMLDVHTTCTNRDLASRYHRAGDELNVPLGGPEDIPTARLLHAPTTPLRPPLRRAAHWRLLAQLSLNHVPLSDSADGRAALQEILRLCDFADLEQAHQLAAVNRQMIEGVVGLRSRLTIAPATSRGKVGYCRGVEFTVELDELKYVGTGTLLFASVLERFLGLYATVNSFSQLSARTKQSEGFLKRWPPRAAERQLR